MESGARRGTCIVEVRKEGGIFVKDVLFKRGTGVRLCATGGWRWRGGICHVCARRE